MGSRRMGSHSVDNRTRNIHGSLRTKGRIGPFKTSQPARITGGLQCSFKGDDWHKRDLQRLATTCHFAISVPPSV